MVEMRSRCSNLIIAVALAVSGAAGQSHAQELSTPADPTLFLVDEQTTVSSIRFEFVDQQTFSEAELLAQLATEQANPWTKFKFWQNNIFPFDPVQLAKDVVHLRNFYNRNGFLFPQIDYRRSRYNAEDNSVDITFRIAEGEPIIIQDFGFFDSDGNYLAYSFDGELLNKWTRYRDRISLELGSRFTFFQEASIQGQLTSWLNEISFAHAIVRTESTIDSVNFAADVRFVVDLGPSGRFSEIIIEGTERVSKDVITRELPFTVGDPYSRKKMIEGQRELFGLKLFRVVTADLPDQDRDSTVTVRYRVRESKLRFVSPNAGYSLAEGLASGIEWRHRNFQGGGRNLTFKFVAKSGLLASPGGDNVAPRFIETSVALLQPALFSRKLTGTITPFVQFERDAQLEVSGSPWGLNRREYGVSSSAVYEIYPFRTVSLSHRFGFVLHTSPINAGSALTRDPFNRSIVSLTGSLGWTNNFFNPRRGFRITPLVETGSSTIGSEIEYFKVGADVVGFVPVTRGSNIVARLSAGTVTPLGKSSDALDGSLTTTDSLLFENRFEDILLYAGGATSVRGWPDKLLGAKVIKETRNSSTSNPNYAYEAVGGRSRVVASMEFLFPFPGLGSKWKLATFVDAGVLSSASSRDASGALQAADNGKIDFSDAKFGTGSGVRYETPFGFVRLDLAYKLNPSTEDLQSPAEAFAGSTEEDFVRRFRLHLTIGQAF